MFFEELENIIEKAGFIEPFTRCLKLEFGDGFIQLRFTITDEEDYDRRLIVLMKADKCTEYRLVEEESSMCYLSTDHSVLLRYTDTTAELYLSSPASDPEKVSFELWQLHYYRFENYLPFEFNIGLLKTGYGLLVKGPVSFLNECAACLNRYGIKNSIVEYSSLAKSKKVPFLFFFGNNYFVADNFDFQIENE